MNPVSRATLARAFTIGGVVVAMPSLAMLAFYAVHTLRQRHAPLPPDAGFGDRPDGVLGALQGTLEVLDGAARLAGALAQIVLDAAALAATAGCLLACACWVIGRGLRRRAVWARVGAGLMLVFMVLVACALALSMSGIGRLPGLALVVLGALGLHLLWTGTDDSAPHLD
ncbi:MAG: hypothetical protein KF788_09020 [Piscinibacter sp.]|nr:hypothetical protein [Piscinibacter sp.]